LDLWKNSRLADVQSFASWAISSLPVIDRELKPLPEPDADSIKFIKGQFLLDKDLSKPAALVIGFYWKKPWSDEELAQKVEKTETKLWGWKRNKARILEALGAR
jgi:hypothetical protein